MKKKILTVLLCGIMVLGTSGCGSEDSKTKTSDGVEFNYSSIFSQSEKIGKSVDVKTVLNEDIKPSLYERVQFTGNTSDLGEANVKVGNINWVILAEDDNNYMLTTVKPTSDTIELKAQDGYNNGVQALNVYCAKYYSVEINGKKYVARSINMDDIEAYYKDKTDSWKRYTLGFENYNKTGVEAIGYQYYPALYKEEKGSNMCGRLNVNETINGYEPYNGSYKSDGTSTSVFYYGPYQRVGKDTALYDPNYACPANDSVNEKVGLLSVDEYVYAGGAFQTGNSSFILNDSGITTDWWTLSPSYYDHYKGNIGVFLIKSAGSISDYLNNNTTTNAIGIRPVITISGDYELAGSGAKTDPWHYA